MGLCQLGGELNRKLILHMVQRKKPKSESEIKATALESSVSAHIRTNRKCGLGISRQREQQFSSGIVLGSRRSVIHKKTRRIQVNSLSCQDQIFRNQVIQMSETSWKFTLRISWYIKLYWSGVDLILSRTQAVPSKVHLLAWLTAHLALTYTVHP